MNFNKLEDGSYDTLVPSSDPRKTPYRVIVQKNDEKASGVDIICTCPGYGWRADCRHSKIVYTELKNRARQESQR